MRKKTTLLLLTLLVGIVSVAPGVIAEEDEAVVEPFIYGVSSNPSAFDPLGAYDTTSGAVILNTLEGLYAFDYDAPEGIAVVPRLASEMGTWNDDKTVLTIPLRDDVYWWDGEKFVAEDVVWNFNRLNSLSEQGLNEHKSLWLQADGSPILDSIEATGTYEVEMTFSKHFPQWEKLLPFWGAGLIKPVDDLFGIISLEDIDLIIGTGPFMLESYTSNEETVIVRFDDYYRGAADIGKIVFKYFADSETLSLAMMNKEIDVVRSVLEADYADAVADPDIHCELLLGDCVYFYHMHVDNIPWEVRKAMQFAFNYSFIPYLYGPTLPVHTHPIPKEMDGYNADLPGLPYYDLDLAREYILNSPDTSIQANLAANSLDEDSTTDEWRAAAASETPVASYNFTHYGTSFYTFISNFAMDIGINIESLIVGDWPTFLEYTSDPDNVAQMQFSMGGWCPDYYDPVNMLEPLFHTNGSSNWNGLDNATINANMEDLYELEDNSDEKQAKVDEVVTQIIVEQAAAMYTIGAGDYIAWNTDAETGILGGADGLLNGRGDKYFYPIDFAPSEVPPPERIPGFDLGLMFLAVLGISAFLVIRNRK